MTTQLGILYEHPDWFKPLFNELNRREIEFGHISASEHRYDIEEQTSPYSLVLNRVSPSSYLRGNTSAMFHALHYLQHLETIGTPVINGVQAHLFELSKARQLTLLHQLGIRYPKSRVVNAPSQIVPAADTLEYPVIVKPNIGGSGALMKRFNSQGELQQAVDSGQLDDSFGVDFTAIVQEFHPPVDRTITRAEYLDGKVLYAINIINPSDDSFDLCPAGIGADDDEPATSEFDNCPVEPATSATQAFPDESILADVRRIFPPAGITIGGVEFLRSERDGEIYFYDVNAVSNFIANAPKVIGFDPFVTFVDYLETRIPSLAVAGNHSNL